MLQFVSPFLLSFFVFPSLGEQILYTTEDFVDIGVVAPVYFEINTSKNTYEKNEKSSEKETASKEGKQKQNEENSMYTAKEKKDAYEFETPQKNNKSDKKSETRAREVFLNSAPLEQGKEETSKPPKYISFHDVSGTAAGRLSPRKSLGQRQSHDKYNVYYQDSIIEGARKYSFEVLNSLYAKDSQSVYYKDQKIESANASQINVLSWAELAKDDVCVYYHGQCQEGIDQASFRIVSPFVAEDKNFLYTEEKGQLIAESKYPDPLKTPAVVRGIYMHGYSITNDEQRGRYIDFVLQTELNTVVIDIKASDGRLLYVPTHEKLKKIPQSISALPREEWVHILDQLQAMGIYTIARVTTFQDSIAASAFPEFALRHKNGHIWKNWLGIQWLDMTNKDAWEIPVLQAKEAASLGFDEIQFDYIRFPSDGYLKNIAYQDLPSYKPKYEVMREFFKYQHDALDFLPHKVSADLFGLTYKKYARESYDLGIGQRLVDAAPYFDYLSPMVYPSHYGPGEFGVSEPIKNPYKIIDQSMKEGAAILSLVEERKASSRPWIQDFSIQNVHYGAKEVREQINASEKNGAGWLLWNARNVYTTGALRSAEPQIAMEE